MKISRYVLLILACFVFLAIGAEAQRRPTTRRPVARPTPRLTPRPILSADMRTAKEKVSNQLSNVNLFIDTLSPIAVSIESIDREASSRRVAKTTVDRNDENKKKVVLAIRNLKEGLLRLESDFRTKVELRKFLVYIDGISDLAAQSEDAALAGRFVASRDPLREIVKKLTDTQAALPKG